MIPETCPDHIPLKSLCCYFCPTKAQIRTYLTVLILSSDNIYLLFSKNRFTVTQATVIMQNIF